MAGEPWEGRPRLIVFDGEGPSLAAAHQQATAAANRWLADQAWARVIRAVHSETLIHPISGRFYAALTIWYEE